MYVQFHRFLNLIKLTFHLSQKHAHIVEPVEKSHKKVHRIQNFTIPYIFRKQFLNSKFI